MYCVGGRLKKHFDLDSCGGGMNQDALSLLSGYRQDASWELSTSPAAPQPTPSSHQQQAQQLQQLQQLAQLQQMSH
jgi:hypothetical protein